MKMAWGYSVLLGLGRRLKLGLGSGICTFIVINISRQVCWFKTRVRIRRLHVQ